MHENYNIEQKKRDWLCMNLIESINFNLACIHDLSQQVIFQIYNIL